MNVESLRKLDNTLRQRLDKGESLDQGLKELIDSLVVGAKEIHALDDYRCIKEIANFWESVSIAEGKAIKIEVPEPQQPLEIPAFYQMTDADFKSVLDLQAYNISQDRKERVVKQLQDLITEQGVEVLVANPGLIRQMIGDEKTQAENDWNLAHDIVMLKILRGSYDFASTVPPESYWRLENTWLSDVVETDAYFDWEIKGTVLSPSSHLADYYSASATICDRIEHSRKNSPALFNRITDYIAKYRNNPREREALIRVKADRLSKFRPANSDIDNWLCAETYVENYYSNIASAVQKDEDALIKVLLALDAITTSKCGNEMINCFEMSVAIWFLDGDKVREIRARGIGA